MKLLRWFVAAVCAASSLASIAVPAPVTQAWYKGFYTPSATGYGESFVKADRSATYFGYYFQVGTAYHADLLKLDRMGNTLWLKDLTYSAATYPVTLTTDSKNNVYLGLNSYSGSKYSASVMEFDVSGNPLRNFTYSNPSYSEYILGTGRDKGDNFYVGLNFNQTLRTDIYNSFGTQIGNWADNSIAPSLMSFKDSGLCLASGLNVGASGFKTSLYNGLGTPMWSRSYLNGSTTGGTAFYSGGAYWLTDDLVGLAVHKDIIGSSSSYNWIVSAVQLNGLTLYNTGGTGSFYYGSQSLVGDWRGGFYAPIVSNPSASAPTLVHFDDTGKATFSFKPQYNVLDIFAGGFGGVAFSYENGIGTPYIEGLARTGSPEYNIPVMLGGGAANNIGGYISCCDCCCDCDDPYPFTVAGTAYIGNQLQPYVSKYEVGDVVSSLSGPTSVRGGNSWPLKISANRVLLDTLKVDLSSNNPNLVVPSTTNVFGGTASSIVAVPASAVNTSQSATITATAGPITKTVTVSLLPATVGAFTLGSSTVKGGTALSATLTLDGTAGSSGTLVHITSDHPTVIPNVNHTFSSGQKTSPLSITTDAVTANTVVVLTATGPDGTNVKQTVTVTK